MINSCPEMYYDLQIHTHHAAGSVDNHFVAQWRRKGGMGG